MMLLMAQILFLIISAFSKKYVNAITRPSSSKLPPPPTSPSQSREDLSIPIWNDSMMERFGGQVLAESAIIDKETGRVYWEGRKTSIAASLSPIFDDLGLRWMKATIFTILLNIALISLYAKILTKGGMFEDNGTAGFPLSVFVGFIKFSSSWIIPDLDMWIIITIFIAYLVEAYFSNTREHLANVMASGKEFEDYMKRLREADPIVTWRVRCFHYELRHWAKLWYLPELFLQKLLGKSQEDHQKYYLIPKEQSLWNKKVVTHCAKTVYDYNSSLDHTIVGIWRRSSLLEVPNFTKIITNQMLLLANEKARQDYFQQQAKFVSSEGRNDDYAEFSTNLHIEGFPVKLLAIQNRPSFFFQQNVFWLFTLIGLTLPYRFFLSKKCDILRITIAKESFLDEQLPKKKISWFHHPYWKKNSQPSVEDAIQQIRLYANQQENKDSVAAVDELFNDVQAARQNYAKEEEAAEVGDQNDRQ